jgi:hypothetical protein
VTDDPDVGHELSGLLENREWFSRRHHRHTEYRVSLAMALTELENWLNDKRDYKKVQAQAWATMTADVTQVFGARGPAVTGQTPSLDALIVQLKQPDLGADKARRQQCGSLVASSRAKLAQQATATAALDDLVGSAQNPSTPASVLQTRADVLEDCLRAAGRTVTAILEAVGRALNDSLWGVNNARAKLGDQTTKLTFEDIDKSANLPIADRLDLCRRLLQHQDRPADQIVWFCFDNASIRASSSVGTVAFGPVTFFDGKALVEAVTNGTELYHPVDHPDGSTSHAVTPIPPELTRPDDRAAPKWPDWPPQVEQWVAARVDLGQEQLVDPVRTAAQQVDTLVQLAAFYTNGTRWQRMSGYKYLSSGGGVISPFCPHIDDRKFDQDHTANALDRLATQLAAHLPVQDPHLGELLDAAAVLHDHREDLNPNSILDSARVIDRVSELCGGEHWIKHLEASFAVWWARDLIEDTIASALQGVQEHQELAGLQSLPDEAQLYSYRNGQQQLNYEVVVQALPHLAAELPVHHPAARLVRTVAARTATPPGLAAWVDECITEYSRLVARLLRCRNSLVHGGPSTDGIAQTVQELARTHAKRSIGIALWGVADGSSVDQAHQRERTTRIQWRDQIPTLATAADALRRPQPPSGHSGTP